MPAHLDNQRRTRRVLGSLAAVVLLLALATYWSWTTHKHPAYITGQWLIDDLRTERDDSSPVNFSATGSYDGDPAFAVRWRFEDGAIEIREWRSDGDSLLERYFSDTTVYSWFAGAREYWLIPQFNADRTEMTLAFPGEKPHARLRRISAVRSQSPSPRSPR